MEAATAGEGNKPAKATTIAYRDALTRLWLLDPIPGWHPSPRTPLARVTQAPKHQLTDPALATTLLNLEPTELLDGAIGGVGPGPAGGLPGAFFESLVTLDVRGYAQAIGPAGRDRVQHLRTRNGLHEVDLIVEGAGLRVLAIEIKLTSAVNDDDVRHLRWLQSQLSGALLDAMIVTTGHYAYRRQSDGIAVVPAALLGP